MATGYRLCYLYPAGSAIQITSLRVCSSPLSLVVVTLLEIVKGHVFGSRKEDPEGRGANEVDEAVKTAEMGKYEVVVHQ